MSNEINRLKDEEDPREMGLVPLNEAALLLGERYQKARDLMNRGDLGPVWITSTGRYHLSRKEVLKRAPQG